MRLASAPSPVAPAAPAAASRHETAPAARAPAPAVVALRDLPDSVRAQFPALQVSGVTYSSNPLYRMAIVNGQVLHEGDTAAQDVVLELIEPERVVWKFRDQRIAQPAR